MSDLREFPMQPPAETPEVIEINPLAVWPFLEEQWERDRKRQHDEREEQRFIDYLRGNHGSK